MKKPAVLVFLVTGLLALNACGSTSSTKSSESSASSTSNSNTDSSKEQGIMSSIFTGTLVEDATVNDDESKTVRLVLEKIEAVEDPGKIIASMKSDGVILNVPKEIFAKDLNENELVAGTKIQFTLTGLPIMTMSIPPQIPGDSISLVEKII